MTTRRYLIVIAVAAVSIATLRAQQPPPSTPRAAAPIDLTGVWVSLVTEEWRWRMTTPPRGDYISLPLSDEGRRVADTWTPAMDGSCKAYGAGGVMWMPTRLRIAWDGDRVLKVETDAGQQTRLLGFDAARPAGPPSLQGFSVATWEPIGGAPVMPFGGGRANPPQPAGHALKVVTTNLTEGWLRRNGAPYSDRATVTEYWDRVAFPNGDDFLVVSIYLTDPLYLTSEYTRSAHFKRESDASKWRPTPCRSL
ncbi:MAG TPA: hypothetical protein VFD69_04970 [Vicinamibacterales bacterium]|nr:hypothetical protein [Vicinamibacterales bacterium]